MIYLNNFIIFIILYLVLELLFTQSYKLATKGMENAGALTILIETLAAFFCLLFIPFFEIKFPTDLTIYLLLFLAIIFYTINDRLGTIVRSGIEATSFNIIKQLSIVFMILIGIFFFKEPIMLKKVIGIILILFSNIFVFYQKDTFKWNKYLILGIIANLCYATALFIDVNNSDLFNLPLYVFITLFTPSILILFLEKVKGKDILKEFQKGNQKAIIVTALSWGTMIICILRAYQLENVTLVAPLTSLSVILNVIVGYLFLGEKDHLVKKIVSSILIVISMILIKG